MIGTENLNSHNGHDMVLTIRLRPTGECNVEGPIASRGMCYMMLKLAEKAIDAWRPEKGLLKADTVSGGNG